MTNKRNLEAVPLLEPKPEPAQPAYPHLSFAFVPEGLQMRYDFGPGAFFATTISHEAADRLCQQWREHRKAQASQLQTLAAVQRTRND